MPGSVRVPVYVPEEILEELEKAYSECKSRGEVLLKFILETLAEWIDKRSFTEKLVEQARIHLLRKYPDEYHVEVRKKD